MAVIRASDNSNLMDVALSKVFYRYIPAARPEYKRWINVERMDRAWEDYMKAAAFGALPQKDEGSLFQFENIATSSTKRIETLEFGLGYIITRKMRDDEKHGVVIGLTQGLRDSVEYLYEVRSYRILNNAFSTADSNFLGLSGKSLCATDHPLLKDGGSTQANRPSTDVDMTSATVEAAVNNYAGMKRETGFPARVTPKIAIFNYGQQYDAARIFRNAMQAGTANNDENWVRKGPDENGITDYIASPYITDTNAWFLTTDKSQHDAVLRVRVSPEFRVGSDFRTDNMLARVYTRIESTFYNYYQWYGSSGSS